MWRKEDAPLSPSFAHPLQEIKVPNHNMTYRRGSGLWEAQNTYVLFSPFGAKTQATRDARTTKTRPIIIDQLYDKL